MIQKYILFLLSLPLLVHGSEICCNMDDFEYFANASYTYWYVQEDGLNIAESAIAAPGGQTYLATNAEVLKQSFSYCPGFQVELGFTKDNWGLSTQYTWVRANNSTNKAAPTQDSILGTSTWSIDDWFLQTTLQGQSLTGPEIHSKSRLEIDMLNLLATNRIYRCEAFDVTGSIGLCAVWIRQRMSIFLTQDPSSVGSAFLPPQPIESSNRSHAWGVGPQIGLATKYSLPQCFRIEGGIACSLLYTQFSDVFHHEDAASLLNVSSSGNTLKLGAYQSVEPILQLCLGLGWNSSTLCDCFRFDVLVGYDFTLFWNQNRMRGMLDQAWAGIDSAVGDLSLQGLTVKVSVGF